MTITWFLLLQKVLPKTFEATLHSSLSNPRMTANQNLLQLTPK